MNKKNTNHEAKLATSPMLPLILRMALPCMTAQLVNLLYSIIDRIYIGHIPDVGTTALAGVGVTSSIIILITAFSAIVGMGGAPLAAIALGQGDRLRAERILGNGLVLLVVFTAVTSFVCYIFMQPILLATGASATTLPYATEYLSYYLPGTIFVMVAMGLNTFINVQGRPAIAMWSVVVGALLNITLDPLFIFYFDMGVRGAALATVLSQCVSATVVLIFLCSPSATLGIKLSCLPLSRPVVLSVLALGVSPFIMCSTEAFVGFVLNSTLQRYGDIHVSAMAVMQSAMLLACVPLNGFAQGFMPIVSYNYGQGNMTRVRECVRISMIIMGVLNLTLVLFIVLCPSIIASAFTHDTELISLISRYMPIFFIGLSLFGLQRTCQSVFISLGQARISVFIALLRKVILLIPLVYLFSDIYGVIGVYSAEAVADAISATVCTCIFYFMFGKILNRAKH